MFPLFNSPRHKFHNGLDVFISFHSTAYIFFPSIMSPLCDSRREPPRSRPQSPESPAAIIFSAFLSSDGNEPPVLLFGNNSGASVLPFSNGAGGSDSILILIIHLFIYLFTFFQFFLVYFILTSPQMHWDGGLFCIAILFGFVFNVIFRVLECLCAELYCFNLLKCRV